MQVKKQQLELDMEQQTDSKLEKEYIKAVYRHPAYLTYMQSTSCNRLGWRKPRLESRLPGEISITSEMQRTPSYDRKQRGTKEPPDEVERGELKSWLKTQHSKDKDYGIWSHHFTAKRWGNSGNSDRLYFLRLQNYCTIALTSQASKVMLKILQARLQQYMDFQMFKLDLEKAEEP